MQFLKKYLFIICLAIIIFPKQVHGSSLMEVPSSFQFPSVTLTGETQDVQGGGGRIVVGDLLGLLENWRVTVQAAPIRQVGGTGITLPIGSLQLNGPSAGNNTYAHYIKEGSPWIIDRGEPVEILNNGLLVLGIGTIYSFDFGYDPFQLTIPSGTKLIDSGQESADYETTITWTLISAGVL